MNFWLVTIVGLRGTDEPFQFPELDVRLFFWGWTFKSWVSLSIDFISFIFSLSLSPNRCVSICLSSNEDASCFVSPGRIYARQAMDCERWSSAWILAASQMLLSISFESTFSFSSSRLITGARADRLDPASFCVLQKYLSRFNVDSFRVDAISGLSIGASRRQDPPVGYFFSSSSFSSFFRPDFIYAFHLTATSA